MIDNPVTDPSYAETHSGQCAEDSYMATMGKIAQVARFIVGGKDINGFRLQPATIENAAPLLGQLRTLLDEYDRQMIEAARDE